jgi:cell division septum initiation protein DivIVA
VCTLTACTPILQVLTEVRCLRDDNQQLAQELAGLRSSTAGSSGDSSSSSADYKALSAKARKLERHNARLTLLLRDVRDNFAKVKECS